MLQDDAAEAEWHDVAALPQPLAFDHKEIVREAFQHLLCRPQGLSGAPLSTMQSWSRLLQLAGAPDARCQELQVAVAATLRCFTVDV